MSKCRLCPRGSTLSPLQCLRCTGISLGPYSSIRFLASSDVRPSRSPRIVRHFDTERCQRHPDGSGKTVGQTQEIRNDCNKSSVPTAMPGLPLCPRRHFAPVLPQVQRSQINTAPFPRASNPRSVWFQCS